jgi:ribosomal protein S18 acetylase RimI-like enzyme
MDETITIVRVPTGMVIPDALQQAQDRLLSRFGDMPSAKNVQAVVDNPKTALIFALQGYDPSSEDDWQAVPESAYVGTITLMMLQTTAHDVAHIDEIVVESGNEGKGIGKRLMQKAIEVGHEHNISRFDLTSRPDKVAANALYEKIGFKKRETNVWRYED